MKPRFMYGVCDAYFLQLVDEGVASAALTKERLDYEGAYNRSASSVNRGTQGSRAQPILRHRPCTSTLNAASEALPSRQLELRMLA